MIVHTFIYCRVSSKKQFTEGNGLDAQEASCIKKAQQLGYTVANIYKEEGITGCADLRPALERLFFDAARLKKKIDKAKKPARILLLVDDVSRLARALEIHIGLQNRVKNELGGSIEYVKQKFEDSSHGRALEQIYSVFSSLEREANRERVIDRMRARFEAGVDTYGHAKMVYVYAPNPSGHGQIQTPHPTNAPIISQALKCFAYGELTSVKQVKEYLDINKLVHEKGRRKGKVRTNTLSTVRNVLNNAHFYAGFIENKKNGFDLRIGKHTAIIDTDTFQLIEHKLGRRSVIYEKASENDYILKGWIICDECGSRLTSNGIGSRGQNKTRYPYYYCHNKECINCKKGMSPEIVHKDFEALLTSIRSHPELLQVCENISVDLWKQRIANRRNELIENRKRLADIEKDIETCANQLLAHQEEYVLIPLKKKMQALHTEKSIIESKLQERTTFDDDIEKLIWRVNALFSHPILLWRKAPLKDRRTMLNLLFPQKLRYARLQGFRKAENPLIYAAHSGFSDEESGLAHPKGFEPLAF